MQNNVSQRECAIPIDAATRYVVQVSTDGGKWRHQENVPPGSRTARLTGLTAETHYLFRIVTQTAAGTSPPSEAISVTTNPIP